MKKFSALVFLLILMLALPVNAEKIKFKAKDADLFVKTLAHVLRERSEATVTVIGRGSWEVGERVSECMGVGVSETSD